MGHRSSSLAVLVKLLQQGIFRSAQAASCAMIQIQVTPLAEGLHSPLEGPEKVVRSPLEGEKDVMLPALPSHL